MLIQMSSPFLKSAGDLKSGVTLIRTSGQGAYVEMTNVPGDLMVSPEEILRREKNIIYKNKMKILRESQSEMKN